MGLFDYNETSKVHNLSKVTSFLHDFDFQIKILKRLQIEISSDLMRLRDRQDKVEIMVVLFGPSKGSPFQGANTLSKGQVDFLGGLLVELGFEMGLIVG